MLDLVKARNECLDRIINHESDIKTAVSIATFLVKQLKVVKEADHFDLMYAKLGLILEDLSKPSYVDLETGEEVYPSIDMTIKIYDVFQLVLKEKENFERPEDKKETTELTSTQVASLERLSGVMNEYENLGNT